MKKKIKNKNNLYIKAKTTGVFIVACQNGQETLPSFLANSCFFENPLNSESIKVLRACVYTWSLVNVWEIISFPNIGKHGVISGRSVKRVTIEIYLISHSRMSNQRSVSCRQSREKEENVLHQKFCFVVFFWKMWETLKLLHKEKERKEKAWCEVSGEWWHWLVIWSQLPMGRDGAAWHEMSDTVAILMLFI